MGYTQFTCDLIGRHLSGVKSVLDFGSQNDYRHPSDKPPFVNGFYKEHGIEDYTCIDIAGDNDSLKMDLSWPCFLSSYTINEQHYTKNKFDLVVDAGFSEHCVRAEEYETVSFHEGHINSAYPKGEIDAMEGFYQCWENKFRLCNVGGLIISENPKTGNWPLHGYSYIDKIFYIQLSRLSGLQILELGEHPASGNSVDGWNVFAVLRKTGDHFVSFDEFKMLPIFPA